MADVAVRVNDPDLARQVFDLVAASRADADSEIGTRTGLVVTDQLPAASGPPGLPTVMVTRTADEGVWRQAAAAGVEQVVELPAGAPLLGQRLRQHRPRRVGTMVRVIGSRGGSGATTLAVGLAVTLSAGQRTVLVDGDSAGSGLDLALGLEDAPGLRWPDLAEVRGEVPAASILARLPIAGDVPVLSHGRQPTDPSAAWRPVTDSLLAAADWIVADVPRYAVARLPGSAHGVDVLVVPPDVVALANTRGLIESGVLRADAVIALRRIRGPMPVGAVAESLPHREVIMIPDCAAVRAGTDFGDLAQAVAQRTYANACRRLAGALGGSAGAG